MGVSALGVLVILSSPLSTTSQAQPLPNWVMPAVWNSFLKLSRLPKVVVDFIGQCAGWGAATVLLHGVPIEGVVPDLCGIVENACFGRITCGFLDDVFERGVRQVAVCDELVELADVGVVVFAVVEIQRFGGDMWFQGAFVVWKVGGV